MKTLIDKYQIKKDVNLVLKSEWKKEVKSKINQGVEKLVRDACAEGSKTRTVKDDVFELKNYLKENTVTEATDILKTRLHMTKLTCNYKRRQQKQIQNTPCPLCGCSGIVKTEHYFRSCVVTRNLNPSFRAI